MVDKSGTGFDDAGRPRAGGGVTVPEIDAWFVREVLPLEATLMQFLRRNSRNRSDVADLCQEVYMRVYEAAKERLPERAKPFVFTIARNLLVDRVKHEHIVSIETVADLDTLNLAIDEPGPDRVVMARDTLRRLQAALELLPQRCREAVVMRKIEGLSRSEIAHRMGITEHTVNRHLTDGMCLLADLVYGETSDTRSPT
jgi:RNA polymerase sigma factor (sigma-70 family)